MSPARHMRISNPHPNIYAFYDGRIEGHRFSDEPNWVDQGALSLGIASYAIVSCNEALVYDTHISLAHASLIRDHLTNLGVTKFTVIYSHWHLDHVAGTGAFADCAVISNGKTAAHLANRRLAIEDASLEGLPAITPLILPTLAFHDATTIQIGNIEVQLIECNIHSDDATVLWLPAQRILLAGDTLEDTVTYVGEPEYLSTHLIDLARLASLGATHILPNHGDPDIIASGGYPASLIEATSAYVTKLMAAAKDETLAAMSLQAFIAPQLGAGSLHYFAPYKEVHHNNIEMVRTKLD
jgi:cyclase